MDILEIKMDIINPTKMPMSKGRGKKKKNRNKIAMRKNVGFV